MTQTTMPPKTKQNLSSLTKKLTMAISNKKTKTVLAYYKNAKKKTKPTNQDAESNNGKHQQP